MARNKSAAVAAALEKATRGKRRKPPAFEGGMLAEQQGGGYHPTAKAAEKKRFRNPGAVYEDAPPGTRTRGPFKGVVTGGPGTVPRRRKPKPRFTG